MQTETGDVGFRAPLQQGPTIAPKPQSKDGKVLPSGGLLVAKVRLILLRSRAGNSHRWHSVREPPRLDLHPGPSLTAEIGLGCPGYKKGFFTKALPGRPCGSLWLFSSHAGVPA